jgi:hypothetical protein
MEDSSSSDDSDLEDILFDDDEQLLLMLAAKEEEDNKRIKRPGSKVDWLCIPRNRTLGHAMLMQDYFSEVPIPRAERRPILQRHKRQPEKILRELSVFCKQDLL